VERPKSAQRTLFVSFEKNKCFQVIGEDVQYYCFREGDVKIVSPSDTMLLHN